MTNVHGDDDNPCRVNCSLMATGFTSLHGSLTCDWICPLLTAIITTLSIVKYIAPESVLTFAISSFNIS